MSVEASEELLGGHSKDPTAAGVDAQVEAEEANASPAAKSEDLATKLANEMAADANVWPLSVLSRSLLLCAWWGCVCE
jgi:hypothetical protein